MPWPAQSQNVKKLKIEEWSNIFSITIYMLYVMYILCKGGGGALRVLHENEPIAYARGIFTS